MQRIRSSSVNAGASALRFATQLIMQLVVRTIFVRILGGELLGLDNLFVNVIQILNVAELGIGAAMGYSMYKPAAEGDIEKLKSYDALFRKIFYVLAGVVLVLGVAVIPMLPRLIQGSAPDGINLYLVYSFFVAETVFSYFAAHKRTLLFVHQQQYINMLTLVGRFLLLGVMQIIMLKLTKNYYYYAAIFPIAMLLESISVMIIAKKMHPLVCGKATPLSAVDKQTLIKNVSALSLHKISGAVLTASDGILVSVFFGLTVLGKFSNYQMIILALTLMLGLLMQSVQASVGNMIVSSNAEENYSVFKSLNLGFWFVVGTVSICLLSLFQPFIIVWLGTDWTLGFAVMLAIVVRFFVGSLRGGVCNVYKDAAGLMRKDWWRAIAEPVLNIVLSIVFLKLWGLAGVFIGTAVAALLTCVWTEPFVVFRHYFKRPALGYFLKLFGFCVVTVVLAAASYFACIGLPQGILFWFLRAVICIGISVSGYCLFYFYTKDFKSLLGLGLTVIKAIRGGKQK